MEEVETTDVPFSVVDEPSTVTEIRRVVIGNGDVVIDKLGSEVMVATDVSFLVVDDPVSVVETRRVVAVGDSSCVGNASVDSSADFQALALNVPSCEWAHIIRGTMRSIQINEIY